ncbi:MAG: hypothetical protein J3K34DRAFT_50858 [Monoraphidium minutum]|nr:MAG: hypothetical protein J3K34DRAFT_50858 [Monoraphidium minutum]
MPSWTGAFLYTPAWRAITARPCNPLLLGFEGCECYSSVEEAHTSRRGHAGGRRHRGRRFLALDPPARQYKKGGAVLGRGTRKAPPKSALVRRARASRLHRQCRVNSGWSREAASGAPRGARFDLRMAPRLRRGRARRPHAAAVGIRRRR